MVGKVWRIGHATRSLFLKDRNVTNAGIKSSSRLPAFGNKHTPDVSLSATGVHE